MIKNSYTQDLTPDQKSEPPFNFHVHSFGCKSNTYEAEAVAAWLLERNGQELADYQDSDLIIFNTCTVTGEAGRKARQAMRRARKLAPDAILVAMGCQSQLEDMSELADFCGGTSYRLELVAEALAAVRQGKGTTPSKEQAAPFPYNRQYEELGQLVRQEETRAKLKVADGCQEFCTYCAICLARGPVRSRDRADILAEAQALIERGSKELVLTATHLTAFEQDLGRDHLALAELIGELAELPGNFRIRLGSLEPQSLTPAFVEAIAGIDKLCPHFHLSLQSGSDRVLKRMNRKYTKEDYRALVTALRQHFDRPSITTDVMVAFPGESEEDFQETYDFCQEIGFSRLHVFRYSRRRHTPAASFPDQVPARVSKERSERLQFLGERLARENALSFIGEEVEIILEQPEEDGLYNGYTARYFPALIDFNSVENEKMDKTPAQGDLWRAKVETCKEGRLYLRPLSLML
ncbi:MAG: tRNA (N(6)-L-threonylcarbamoyladenosine(37)-C(2))-methylthiotransferase MtaB [Eubacteriales bacterium]|nr:tRNA (N(6)-L-threonylcarbamoyladenosine(37)-C(2))-methylthiotransferase MtaB [Eubacteriales bacterium]